MGADYTTFQTSQGELVKLYDRGSAAADVPANARGIAWHEYERYAQALERTDAFRWFARFGAPINEKPVVTPRYGYGMKGAST